MSESYLFLTHRMKRRPVLGLMIALVLTAIAAGFAVKIPAHTAMRMLTPAWMPQQLAQLIEMSNDIQVAFLADQAADAHPKFTLVLVNDETLAGLPYISPIDRALMARIVRAIDAFEPDIIALDFLFDQATEPYKDKELIDTLRKTKAKIVLGAADGRAQLSERRRAYQRAFLDWAERPVGYLNLRYDAQEASGQPIVRYRANAEPDAQLTRAFAEVIATEAGAKPPPKNSRRIAWLTSPKSGGDTFTAIDAQTVLAASNDRDGLLGQAIGSQLKDRIVIVGGDFAGRDRHATPLTLLEDEDATGLSIHAQIAAALIDGRSITDIDDKKAMILMSLAAFLGAILGWFGPRRGFWFSICLSIAIALICGLGALALWHTRAIVPLAIVAASLIGSALICRLISRFTRREALVAR